MGTPTPQAGDTTISAALDVLLSGLERQACPRCVTASSGRAVAVGRWCLHCSELDMGMSVAENSERIEAGLTVSGYLRRPADGRPLRRIARPVVRRLFARGRGTSVT